MIATKKFDTHGNLVYQQNTNGEETWLTYNSDNKLIRSKSITTTSIRNTYISDDEYIFCKEITCEYDPKGNLIHYKDSSGYESWYHYNEQNKIVHYHNSHGEERWYTYDDNNNIVYIKYREDDKVI